MNGATVHRTIHETDALNIDFLITVFVGKHSGFFPGINSTLNTVRSF